MLQHSSLDILLLGKLLIFCRDVKGVMMLECCDEHCSFKVILMMPCPLVMLDCISVTYLYQIRCLILAFCEFRHDRETRTSKGLELVLAAAPSFMFTLYLPPWVMVKNRLCCLGPFGVTSMAERSVDLQRAIISTRSDLSGDAYQAEGGTSSSWETNSIFCRFRNQIFRFYQASVNKDFYFFNIVCLD